MSGFSVGISISAFATVKGTAILNDDAFEAFSKRIVLIAAGSQTGTGTFITERIIVTCAHVLSHYPGDVIRVTDVTGNRIKCEIVARNRDYAEIPFDLAVLITVDNSRCFTKCARRKQGSTNENLYAFA